MSYTIYGLKRRGHDYHACIMGETEEPSGTAAHGVAFYLDNSTTPPTICGPTPWLTIFSEREWSAMLPPEYIDRKGNLVTREGRVIFPA